MFSKIKTFFEESRSEFRHVNWPTRQEGIRLTGIVIIISIILAVFLGLVDFGFTSVIKALIIK